MQTFLMVPTAVGVGLTSACLGMIRALDCVGLQAGFLKPFVQQEINGKADDRSSSLIGRTLQLNPPTALSQSHVERMLGDDHLDELLEEIVALHQQAGVGMDAVKKFLEEEGGRIELVLDSGSEADDFRGFTTYIHLPAKLCIVPPAFAKAA